MARNKKNSKYTIVYVYGPTRCKTDYLSNLVLNRDNGEFVKIGKTDFDGELSDCTEESLKQAAIERCSQETKTGISDWCDIYDTFIFPQSNGQNVDDIIRNILCNDVYSLDNSKAESKIEKGDIKPGKEFVYGVSRNHIIHAVESYCFQLIIGANDEVLKDIQTICKINANIGDNEDNEFEQEEGQAITSRKNRDISMVIGPDTIVYLTDARDKNNPVYENEGKQIQAIYVGDKKFKYGDEEPKYASPLAIELINRFKGTTYTAISGNHCWMVDYEVDGKTTRKSLAELYDAIVANK